MSIHWGKNLPRSGKGARKASTCERMIWGPYLAPYTKVRLVNDLNLSAKTI